MNNKTNFHFCYDISLFNEIESFEYEKSIEIIIENYISIEKIESIIFDFVIDEKKIKNIVIEMKYVFDVHYNFISTNILCRKKYKIKHDDKNYIITNKNIDEIFMINTLQSYRKNNSYIMNR